ncbi:MAG: ABC transporter permease [Candidatus Omnitrophica bacterium]|nr:ABC transporter permease [Candidatus Omnitrophota bacterium]
MLGMISGIGSIVLSTLSQVGGIFILFGQTLYWMFIGPFIGKAASRKNIFAQMVFTGANSLLIVFFVSFFTGIVLAMQSAYQLAQLGAEMYVASLVAVSMARELGPVLTALVVAGRVGAAITAELGSMKVTEQIEALQTQALNPVRYLVVPRFLALLVMLPCLTIFSDLMGMLGGYVMGVFNIGINSGMYIDITIDFLTLKDIYTGLIKSVFFGMIIALIGCYMGLNTSGGAEGVGRATTVSVVTSFIMVILADCILTGIFFFSQM